MKMNIDRIQALIEGYTLPQTESEDLLLFVYTSALVGVELFDIYMESAHDLGDDAELHAIIIIAYALAEKQIATYGIIPEGDMQ